MEESRIYMHIYIHMHAEREHDEQCASD